MYVCVRAIWFGCTFIVAVDVSVSGWAKLFLVFKIVSHSSHALYLVNVQSERTTPI